MGWGVLSRERWMERKKRKNRGTGETGGGVVIRSSEQNGWDLKKLGPVGGLRAVALGEPLCSRLSGSWERPANTDKLGVGRCEETWLMLPAGQKVEGVTGTVSTPRAADPLLCRCRARIQTCFPPRNRSGSRGQHCGSSTVWNSGAASFSYPAFDSKEIRRPNSRTLATTLGA